MPVYRLNSTAWKDVPFAVKISKEEYQALLLQLPTATVNINKANVIDYIARSLKSKREDALPEKRVSELAETIYTKDVLPFLSPRVSAFNDSINQAGKGERITTGLLSIAGIANTMEGLGDGITSATVGGTYFYNYGDFENGKRWEFSEAGLTGLKGPFNAENKCAIDETLKVDLTPYGGDGHMSLFFHCSGVIRLEQENTWDYEEQGNLKAGPKTTVKIRPCARVTGKKTISSSTSFLNVDGETHLTCEREFPYPAILLLELEVEESDWTPAAPRKQGVGTRLAGAEAFESLSRSPVWQVRYCIAGKLDSTGPVSREILERLAADRVPQVARQAFEQYSRRFVALDDALVQAAFSRGDFDLLGADVTDRKVFQTPEFWINDLKATLDPAIQARGIRALGMCGTQAHVGFLSEYAKTDNPYLLIQLALAFHRLGDSGKYLAALDSILRLPIRDALHYQTYAIDCLIQTHPERARSAWGSVHKQFEDTPEIQPNWVYAHIVQEAGLSIQR